MFSIDWHHLFGVDHSLAELVIRGTVMYWFLFAIFRFVLRRDIGAIGVADVLLVVVIADASQNAFTDDYDSLTEGFVVVATLVFWNYLVDWLGFHSRRFERFAEPPPLPLIRDGQLLVRNLRRELLTEDELKSKLREQGIEAFAEVRWAYMESDGEISLRTYAEDQGGVRRRKPRTGMTGAV
ncbi:DUF421 domain-containing protein [Aquabacterium sp. J223]|uniref:DUF421 domain-containing protein n=1 Tax=Aquabacterium sp. J223 TaxID=2898431 RepID=UPI0021AD66EA|nr:YetF domain-containing protein [Aquabacterium sp. J223]UUX95055.1 DUF421 domain-containing protein [Aquabacterium sp. J223]